MRRHGRVVAALAALVLVAGCGAGASEGPEDSTTVTDGTGGASPEATEDDGGGFGY